MNDTLILNDAQIYVHEYFLSHFDARYVYHNETHTQMVVDAAKQIANHYKLNDKDFFIVKIAALFHDLGYFTQPLSHETEGVRLAEDFLKSKNIDDQTLIDEVKGCILATHLPQSPKNLLEQIVCDADLFHLGTSDFSERNKLMRKEVELIKNTKIDKEQWREGTIKLFEQHHYQTDYVQTLLNGTKALNLQGLKEKEAEHETANLSTENGDTINIINTEAKKKNKRPDKGIETMFRIASGNNQRLSRMADNKAHIMISVNSIILSAIISLILKNLHDHQFLAIPTFIILSVSVLTMIFSILATRPSVSQGSFSEEDIQKNNVNLLFFGNFYKMNLEQYTNGMLKLMDNSDFLYGSLIKDVYFQGVVLAKKYKLLRISYNVFMFGLIIAVIAYIIAALISFKQQ